ncbi:MAG: DUF4145 domain-containing protein [Chitinophagaceae bacterium]
MTNLHEHLKISKCPHCSVDKPNLSSCIGTFNTTADDDSNTRYWNVYVCASCGGVVTACSLQQAGFVQSFYPGIGRLDDILPSRVKAYLQQAIDSTFAPSGSLMLCASAVDAMLKEKGYHDGNLYSRIGKASEDHLITLDMAEWAHHVRLEANEQRHADNATELPTIDDAKKGIEFTKTLLRFYLFFRIRLKRGWRRFLLTIFRVPLMMP